MTAATVEFDSLPAAEETFQYRALQTGAIIGLVLAIFTSISTLVAAGTAPSTADGFWAGIMVALANALPLSLCLWSLSKIRREPDRYTGLPLAVLGVAMSFVFLFGGVAYCSYGLLTEVPEGYTPISFNGMKPDELQERGGVWVPPDIAALDGQKVFIKGYIRPDSVKVQRGIDRFLLVRDNNQCCFGSLTSVKYHDQILVDMRGAQRVDFTDRILRIGGVLKIEPQNIRNGALAPVFSLKADYAAN